MVLVFVKSVASVQSLFVALRVESNINELSCKVASYSALSVMLVPESLEVCQYLSVLVRNEVYIPECFLLCVYNGVLFWSSPRYSNFISPLCLGFIFFLCQTLAKVFFFKLCHSLVSWGDGCNFSDPKDSAWVQNWMPAGECSPFYASQWTMGPMTDWNLPHVWVVRQQSDISQLDFVWLIQMCCKMPYYEPISLVLATWSCWFSLNKSCKWLRPRLCVEVLLDIHIQR
jgi:hypothetical protein